MVTINVEQDFDGDLEEAIASAQSGDLVELGATTYNTSGIVIDKNITIQGQEGTVVDGGGTSQAIFDLTSRASGATIENIEITNGNIGIRGTGAEDLILRDLEIHNIGITETIRDGKNNIGISLAFADGSQVLDSEVYNIGRKGVGIDSTDGAVVSGLTISDINLAAENAQSYDAGGIKLYNTNEVIVSDNTLSDINAISIWNDLTRGTTIEGNVVTTVGEDFAKPDFNPSVDIFGIYNEKSYLSTVRDNQADAVGRFIAFQATEFSTETMVIENNDFSTQLLDTTDFWANQAGEIAVAVIADPREADFELFGAEFLAGANIGE